MKKIREIALLVACQAKVFRVPGFDQQVRAIFKHCIAAAAFAQEIARMRRWNVEESFLCGLLHDAEREFRALYEQNPSSPIARDLMASVAR